MRDAREFEAFYRRHMDRVYRFLFFRCGQDRAIAEDLTSDVFLKALDHFDAYDPSISRSAWIMTIARNHLINFWRARKETLSLVEEKTDGEEAILEADRLLLARSLLHQSRDVAVRELAWLLGLLPAKDRELVTMHYLDGYGYKDVAAAVGMTETAVKVAVHRALKRLRSSV